MNAGRQPLPAPDSEVQNLVALLRERAARAPDRIAFRFLDNGEDAGVSVTYVQLDRAARAIAATLHERGAAGERALIVLPPGLDYIAAFFGCLYAGAVAVPAYPPGSARTLPRLLAIAADAQPAAVVTNASISPTLADRLPGPRGIPTVLVDDGRIDVGIDETWRAPSLTPISVAFIQYTSGSTAAPRGVVLTHGNLLHNQTLIRSAFGHDDSTVVMGWLPLYHDMGLIGNVLHPVFLGVPCTLMSPVHFLQRPIRWLQAVSRWGATTSGGPDFAYELCVRKVPAELRPTLDLSGWRVAFNGAEPVRPATMDRFAAAFEVSGFHREAFHPCYGLAEATLMVASRAGDERPVVRTFVPAALERGTADEVPQGAPGRALAAYASGLGATCVRIVDPDLRMARPADRVGEVWVAGGSVAQGYWNRPDETRATFEATLADSGEGPFLRTGDLGFLYDGHLFLTGRLKDLVIIRGRNHHPEDIELTVQECNPSAGPSACAAFSVEQEGEERLVVVQEADRKQRQTPADEIAASARRAVAEQHELRIDAFVLIRPGTLPRTTSGKVRRRACRDAYLNDGLEIVFRSVLADESEAAPVEEVSLETLLAASGAERHAFLARVLRSRVARALDLAAADVSIDRPLTSLGVDSLRAIQLQHELEVELGVQVHAHRLLEDLTIDELAAEVAARIGSSRPLVAASAPLPEQEEWPLSAGQRALWFMVQMDPGSTAHRIARAIRLRGEVDVAALERAVSGVVRRHPCLRTTIGLRDGVPVQRLDPADDVRLLFEDWTLADERAFLERIHDEAQQPFDLERGPLVRVYLMRRTPREYTLLVVAHHLVVDLWSLGVFLRDLVELYRAGSREFDDGHARTLFRYPDYVRWQDEMLNGPEGECLRRYWVDQLAGELPWMDLPADHPRPAVPSFRGAGAEWRLDAASCDALQTIARDAGATLYSTLLAACFVLVHRYTRQDDCVVGSPASGRGRAELADLVGYVTNPLVLRASLGGDPPFSRFVRDVHATVIGALAHQDYPLSLLVEQLRPARHANRSPLFQLLFSFEQLPGFVPPMGPAAGRGELLLEPFALEQPSAQFDLTITAAETEQGLGGTFQYSTDLFSAASIQRMARHWEQLLREIIHDSARRLSDLHLTTDAERQQLAAGGGPRRPLADLTVHGMFRAQVARRPDAPAVEFGTERLSYAQLNQRANRLARYLRALGVGEETRVGLCLERSIDQLVGVLAILKAGGAYVPLDPGYPPDRLAWMLADAAVPVLVTNSRFAQAVPAGSARLVGVDRDRELIDRESAEDPAVDSSGDHCAYVIYTSGSTGTPNGVQVTHRALANLLQSIAEQPGMTPEDVLLSVTTLSFDIATLELLLPLIVGGRVVLVDRATTLDADLLAAALRRCGATMMQATPATWGLLIESGWSGGPGFRAFCGGEALPRTLANSLRARCSALYNLYGPTETTIWSAFAPIEIGDGPVPIGGPIANTHIHVLDHRLRPVPSGIPGEVYIGGAGLARGYLNRPDLTAHRFIPDPFSEKPGSRLYRTGDLARRLADGSLECLGRIDHQVKIRGFRIEVGEIEEHLRRHPAVLDCVVVKRADDPGDGRLVAYAVLRAFARASINGGEAENTSGADTADELRTFLERRLPAFMIPAAFVFLDALPVTPNGKIDRRALPTPPAPRGETARSAPPRTRDEQAIAGIWRDVLRAEQIGVHDNFFDLGGHSLLLVQVRSRLHALVGRDVPIVDLFAHPTIHALARHLREPASDTPPPVSTETRAGTRRTARALQERLGRRRQSTRSSEDPAS